MSYQGVGRSDRIARETLLQGAQAFRVVAQCHPSIPRKEIEALTAQPRVVTPKKKNPKKPV